MRRRQPAASVVPVVASLIKAATPQDPKTDAMMRQIYDGLQQGKIDRSLFTDNANLTSPTRR